MAQKKIKEEEVEMNESDGSDAISTNVDDYAMLEAGKEFDAVVVSIGNIEINHHEKFGDKPFVNVGVDFGKGIECLKLFLPKGRMIRPNSTVGKLFQETKTNNLKGLVGKKVLLKVNKDGYLRWAVEA